MVRKSMKAVRLCSVVCALALLMAMPLRASAYTVYTEGNMSSTYTEIFRDIVESSGSLQDHLCFRSGQYEYILLIGDFDYSDGVFAAEDATEYKITTNNGYSSSYQYSVSEVRSVQLVPGGTLIYSNLGDYPSLSDPNAGYWFAFLVLVMVCIIQGLVRPIFSFTYRRRGGA